MLISNKITTIPFILMLYFVYIYYYIYIIYIIVCFAFAACVFDACCCGMNAQSLYCFIIDPNLYYLQHIQMPSYEIQNYYNQIMYEYKTSFFMKGFLLTRSQNIPLRFCLEKAAFSNEYDDVEFELSIWINHCTCFASHFNRS